MGRLAVVGRELADLPIAGPPVTVLVLLEVRFPDLAVWGIGRGERGSE